MSASKEKVSNLFDKFSFSAIIKGMPLSDFKNIEFPFLNANIHGVITKSVKQCFKLSKLLATLQEI